jgi:NAD(P)-dependent dehydrogenase (short-subunit alcohol dehydrogenase family)
LNIEGKKILVLGGYGLVGTAMCRELLPRRPREIQIHSLRPEESEQARTELLEEAGSTELSLSSGDIFGLERDAPKRDAIRAQIDALHDDNLDDYLLYGLLRDSRPDVVIDCVNTATAIAYRDTFRAAGRVLDSLDSEDLTTAEVEELLSALYMPRLIRHIQLLYRGMIDAGTRIYTKVGTSGTGGMGLNIPYTHSEEKPSRMLLSKSAIAGAHSMLLFLMARTPGAPITKEIKPAAAIAWKRIAHGPISRKGTPINLVDARPRPLGDTFSTYDPEAAVERPDEPLETVFIDTGENGIFSLEEFALLTTAEQMEFVTPEEIARYMIFEIEGGNTGHDIINALDNAVLGPTYRAGLLRHWALEYMTELEHEHETRSVAFEMLGPPRNSKLLFEAHLLRQAFATMSAVRLATPEAVRDGLDRVVREQAEVANRVVAVGIPIVLDSGEILRGTRVIIPAEADQVAIEPITLEGWIHDGWVDLRLDNCRRWIDRFNRISDDVNSISPTDTSSRHVRNRRFWHEDLGIQPGKIVGWILSVEEQGGRFKR